MTVRPNGLDVVIGINRRPAAQISTRGVAGADEVRMTIEPPLRPKPPHNG